MSITLLNQTRFIAQYVVRKDQQVIARLPALQAGAALSIPVDDRKISATFSIYAVINGVTTETVTTSNPNATVTAITDTSSLEDGYFVLTVN